MNTDITSSENEATDTFFTDINRVSESPVMSGLLQTVNGMLAVINEQRQIIALNDDLLKMIGIGDSAEVLGLRPGEVIQCIHAHEEPGGCGTTKWCSTCGLAIAIVSTLGLNKPVERICALSANRGNIPLNVALLVRSKPITVGNSRFILLFLQDITLQEQRAALERTFYHDVNNMLSGLVGASELLVESDSSELVRIIHNASLRLMNEIAIQRCMSENGNNIYPLMRHAIFPEQIVADLRLFFSKHPAAHGKKINFQEHFPSISFVTDISLLTRVLFNMAINALEATQENDAIKVWIDQEEQSLSFYVWNAQEIPYEVTHRVFQRNFSTKKEDGRGFGTFSMKFFGETILGGKVSFTTSASDGTLFKLQLPI